MGEGRVISYPCGCVENVNVMTGRRDARGRIVDVVPKPDGHCAEYKNDKKEDVVINKGTQNEKTIKRFKCEYRNQRESL